VIDLSKWLSDMMANAGISSVLKERLSLAKDQAEDLEKENADLKEQNLRLVTALDDKTVEEEFVEQSGSHF
jgi:hypothetical protein